MPPRRPAGATNTASRSWRWRRPWPGQGENLRASDAWLRRNKVKPAVLPDETDRAARDRLRAPDQWSWFRRKARPADADRARHANARAWPACHRRRSDWSRECDKLRADLQVPARPHEAAR